MVKDIDFKVGSLNVRGINDDVKRKGIFDWAHEKKFDIVMLQECYCCKDVEAKWVDEWGGACLFSHGSKHSKGTMMLFKKGLDIDIETERIDNLGRYIIVKLLIQGEQFILVNIYAPNTMQEKSKFYQDLCNTLDHMNISLIDNIIMAGDWNTIQNCTLDKKGGNEQGGNTVVDSMTQLLGQFDLVDIWRLRSPDLRRFTYRQKTPLILSRLDFFMVSNAMQDNIVDVDIISNLWSDHSAINLSIKHLPPVKKGNSHWKFNASLISDKDYNTLLEERLQQWKLQYRDIHDDRLVWELLKYEIRKFTMSYCSQKKLDLMKVESMKIKELKALEVKLSEQPSIENLLNVERLKEDLKTIEIKRINGAIVRSKVKWVEEGEKSTKFFYDLEKQNYIKKHIRKLKLENDVVTIDQKKIDDELESYYSKLYTANINTINEDDGFIPDSLPKLTPHEKNWCDTPVTIQECTNTLKMFKKSKSPGNDGLTFEFYDRFWNLVSGPLIQSYNAAFQEGELSTSQRQAIITLISKGKDREKLKNWRPISLLNLDYKILSKTLSVRLQKYLPKLIHHNQSGFVKGRFIGDAIRSIQDIMSYTNQKKLNGILLFIDFEKAFDTIELPFLRKVLKKFNFGENFVQWIEILYNNISSCVMNNGSTSKYFPVNRGVRQGDPLSPYLFLLVIEILAIKIRENTDIVGFKIKGGIFKLSLYADDMTLAVLDKKSAKRAFALIKKFANYSGLKVNVEKTEGMWLGQQKGCLDQPLGIAWPKKPIKALGIFHSYNKDECINSNFNDKIEKLLKQLHWWKARNLSLSGKILIVKTLGVSKFALVASLLHVPDKIIKVVNTIIFNFIWNGKTDKVRRKVMIQSHEKGGLKMIDFCNYVKAAKCKWIQRYLDDQTVNWKYSFEYFCKTDNLGIFLRGNFELKELPKSLPNYYFDSIASWQCLKSKKDGESDFIWYNKNFKINGKTVFNSRMFSIGIWSFNDLYKNGQPVPFQFWLKLGASHNDFMVWRGLIHLAKNQQNYLIERGINRGSVKVRGLWKDIDVMSQKEMRESFDNIELCTLKESDFRAKNKFGLINGLMNNVTWGKVFSLTRGIKVTNHMKDLQFKILHRILATNRLLHKMKKNASSSCTFCRMETETLEHLLFNCYTIKNFWFDIFTRWNTCCATKYINVTSALVIYGMYETDFSTEDNAVNLILLIGKAYIWKTKQSASSISLQLFQCYIQQTVEICQQTRSVMDLINKFANEDK